MWDSHERHVQAGLIGIRPEDGKPSETWVWGGTHEYGDGQGPNADDTRVYLRADHSNPGRVIVWALTSAQHERLMTGRPSDPARAARVPPDPPPEKETAAFVTSPSMGR
jgi:hypothetical protein